ncbi:MAG TPA: RodZ domain-containing protein [Gammaproteobacteria bacterium]|nr:RodZ domain-containing protein [Gammaproteobacteria bacterium]
MSDNPENEQQAPHTIGTQTPGETLREAREARNLTRSDVAAQLNLQVDTIAALEEDDHDRLPVSTYVRGYLRSYARLVKLDGEALVERYGNEASEPPEIVPDVKKHSQASSRDKPVKAVTYLVTFGLALLLLAWLQSQYIVDDQNNNNQGGQESTGGGSLDYPIDIVVHPDTPYFDNRTDTDDDYPPLYDGDGSLSDDVIHTMELPNSLSIDETIPESRSGEDTPSATQADADIVMNIREKSWIEVYDAGDTRLYLGLATPGETIRLDGEAPYSVLLGYAPGVEVIFNGNTIDTDQYSDAGVARFNLGE